AIRDSTPAPASTPGRVHFCATGRTCDHAAEVPGLLSRRYIDSSQCRAKKARYGDGLLDLMSYPLIIQGGMGAGISNWRLARAVSQTGQLGVVSGTALDVILARRLQEGDPAGEFRHALSRFPI